MLMKVKCVGPKITRSEHSSSCMRNNAVPRHNDHTSKENKKYISMTDEKQQ